MTAEPAATPPKGLRILLVEDDPVASRTLARLLRYHGHEIVEAANLLLAFERLSRDIEVIILDLMLPDGLGHTLIRHMRSIDHPAQVIVTTGMSSPRDLSDVRSLGVARILQKPINLDELLANLTR